MIRLFYTWIELNILSCFTRYLQLREAAEMLKNVEPELRKCEGYKRNLAAEQVNI
jgi:hypothetical protein